MPTKFKCPYQRSSFGPGNNIFGISYEDREQVLLEPFFLLAFHLGIDWNTFYNWPVSYKRWFIERLQKEMDKRSEAGDIPSKSSLSNTSDARALTGKSRSDSVPNKLRRF